MFVGPPNTLYLFSVEDSEREERVLVLAVWGDFLPTTSVRYTGCYLLVLLFALFIVILYILYVL